MLHFESPTACSIAFMEQIKRSSYVDDAEDAERRMRKGQAQTFCTACCRYKWKHQRCNKFEARHD